MGLMLEPQGPMGSSLTSHIKKKKKSNLGMAAECWGGVGWGGGGKTGGSLVVRERDGDNLPVRCRSCSVLALHIQEAQEVTLEPEGTRWLHHTS